MSHLFEIPSGSFYPLLIIYRPDLRYTWSIWIPDNFVLSKNYFFLYLPDIVAILAVPYKMKNLKTEIKGMYAKLSNRKPQHSTSRFAFLQFHPWSSHRDFFLYTRIECLN